jgi:transcription antitermination factor NusG
MEEMMDQWVILELNQKADGEDPDLIRRSITYAIKGAEVFIPAAVTQQGEDRVVHYLIEGYAFIRHVHADNLYNRLENSKYVQSVVTKIARNANGRPVRELACISTKEVDRMRNQIRSETDQGIGVGDTVLITSGAYKQIQAIVIEDLPESDQVQVHVRLRSKDSIVGLPRSFLRLVQKAPRAPMSDRFALLKDWFNDSHEMLLEFEASPSPNVLLGLFSKYCLSREFADRLEVAQHAVQALTVSLDVGPLVKFAGKVRPILEFGHRWDGLVPLVLGSAIPDIEPIELGYMRLMTVFSFLEQLDELVDDIQSIEDEMGVPS